MKSTLRVLKLAGGYMAWVIGSGFATGQEILQFFSSYGLKSYAVLAVCLIGFAFIGGTLMCSGRQAGEQGINSYYCGKRLGAVYSVIIPVSLVLTMAVLISAAGAAVQQYWGISRLLGCGVMALLVLAAYLAGFKRLLNVVSLIGPVIIAFALIVGISAVIRGGSLQAEGLPNRQPAPHWSLSALLYVSLNFLSGSSYYARLGASAHSKKEAIAGAVLGAMLVIATIAVTNTAILQNAADAAALEVLTLALAAATSPLLAGIFVPVLLLGIFAASSTMMWSFCNGFVKEGSRASRLLGAGTALAAFGLGLVPFGGLLNTVYPLIGYAGIVFIVCVAIKGCKAK